MDQLPKEMLLYIFKQLPTRDLLAISATCRVFNKLVENTDLSANFVLVLNGEKKNEPKRKYKQCTINQYIPEAHRSIIEANAAGIVSVKFYRREYTLNAINAILKMMPNLKNLEFDYVRIESYDQEPPASNDLCQLKNVNLILSESSPEIFSILLNSKEFLSMNLSYYGDIPYSDFRSFKKLLSAQTFLKSLDISGIYESNLFLTRFAVSRFPLREFSLDNCELEETIHLQEFLMQHADTLERVTFKGISWDPSTFINHCTSLKFISITEITLDQLDANSTVVDLKVGKDVTPLDRLLDKFTALKSLKIFNNTSDINRLISAMPHLDKLEINYGPIAELHVPSLNKLKLYAIDGEIERQYIENHTKVVDLTLEYCQVNNNLLTSIVTNMKELKVLRLLGDCQLNAGAFHIIADNCKHLKIFEMTKWDQRYKSSDWDCLYNIKGLKVYQERFN